MTTEQDKATSLKDMKAFEKWRKLLQYITGLGMTEEEQKNFRELMQKELEEYQCNKCEVWKENLLKNSPPVRFMVDELKKIKKEVTKDDFLCLPCDEQDQEDSHLQPLYYVIIDYQKKRCKSIQWCMMVHMYDNTKFKVD
ncbi:unnamed protein product [Rhizopus microsporus]